jgi:hypothetical protein
MQSKSHRNPVEHGDIDTNLVYLNKTKASLENLISLYEEEKIDIEFVKTDSIVSFFKQNKTYDISKYIPFSNRFLLKNLTGIILIYLFNWFRVGYLCSLQQKKINFLSDK